MTVGKPDQINAASTREPNVNQKNVWLRFIEQSNSFRQILCFADQNEVVSMANCLGKSVAKGGIVFDYEYGVLHT
jgi:hypothetical protein